MKLLYFCFFKKSPSIEAVSPSWNHILAYLSVCQIEHGLITKNDLIISLVFVELAVGQAVPLVVFRENLVLLCNPLFETKLLQVF